MWRGVRTWLDRLNGFLLPFYAVALIAVVVWALASEGYHGFLPDAEAAPGTTLPWLQAFSAYMGVWILMMFTMDFARLGRPADEPYHRAVTFGWLYYALTFGLNGLIGILLVSTFGISFEELAGQESALPVQIVGLTGLLGVALIVITQMRINTVNLYLASTNFQSFFSRVFQLNLPRTAWVVVGLRHRVPVDADERVLLRVRRAQLPGHRHRGVGRRRARARQLPARAAQGLRRRRVPCRAGSRPSTPAASPPGSRPPASA